MEILFGILGGVGFAALIYSLFWISWKLENRG